MRSLKVQCTVINRQTLTSNQFAGIKIQLVQLHPLQFEFIDAQIRHRFGLGPEFNLKFNPDRETRKEFIIKYCDQLLNHISKSKSNNLDIQVEWLLNILK